jgi:hypothetical protein
MSEETSATANLVSQSTDIKVRQTTLTVDYVTADVIGITVDMMPGTRPADTGAIVAIWQDQDQIPWEDEPKDWQAVGSQQHGSFNFQGLSVQDNSYIIGLYTGPQKTDAQKNRNVVAQAWIPGVNDEVVLGSDFLTLKFVGPTSVAVQFNCLAGFRASTNKAWLGLWRGEVASYTKPPDVGATKITLDANFGTSAFNNVSIGTGLTYTIGFFPSGWDEDPTKRNQKVLACSLTFTQGKTG